mmetsp:Transcript_17053/g.22971  ORF Transcript_17053/g.22971 Transcript_17053/m.22971 type:complete len:81 (-) Transcript_17053:18-260(-)
MKSVELPYSGVVCRCMCSIWRPSCDRRRSFISDTQLIGASYCAHVVVASKASSWTSAKESFLVDIFCLLFRTDDGKISEP